MDSIIIIQSLEPCGLNYWAGIKSNESITLSKGSFKNNKTKNISNIILNIFANSKK